MNLQNESPYFHVIMPLYSDKQSDAKVEIIQANANKFGFAAHFPKYKKDKPIFDLQTTINTFQNAHFILADLTLERPSCYYELGIAESIGVDIYIIAKEGTDIHQTSHRTEVFFYENLEQLSHIVHNIIEKERNKNHLPKTKTG